MRRKDAPERGIEQENEANFQPAAWGERRTASEVDASDEPAARQVDTCDPAGPPERGGRGQETVAERVNPKEREPAVIEKRPNEANLLMTLIPGIL